MQTKGYGFGGEQSGHMILLELATTGDGLSALALLQALEFHGEDLEEMESIMHVYPQFSYLLYSQRKQDQGDG